jgi:hypothetical protein
MDNFALSESITVMCEELLREFNNESIEVTCNEPLLEAEEPSLFFFEDSTFFLPLLLHPDQEIFSKVAAGWDRAGFTHSNYILYGNLNMPWNSGRILHNNPQVDDIPKELGPYLKKLHKEGMGINFVFTSRNIDLTNPVGLAILEVLGEIEGSIVTLQDDSLLEFIRGKYPLIELKASLLKPTYEKPSYRGAEYYNKLLDRYDSIILHPDDNRDYELLRNLKDISKVEILVNENCPTGCKARKEHYSVTDAISSATTEESLIKAFDRHDYLFEVSCPKLKKEYQESATVLAHEMTYLHSMGIRNWKLQGRDSSGPEGYLLKDLIPYIVKDIDLIRHSNLT